MMQVSERMKQQTLWVISCRNWDYMRNDAPIWDDLGHIGLGHCNCMVILGKMGSYCRWIMNLTHIPMLDPVVCNFCLERLHLRESDRCLQATYNALFFLQGSAIHVIFLLTNCICSFFSSGNLNLRKLYHFFPRVFPNQDLLETTCAKTFENTPGFCPSSRPCR
jgi:hypothetical protein